MLALAVLTAWLGMGERMSAWLMGEPEISVRVAPVKIQSVPETLRLGGMLVPVKEVDAVSQLAGRIAELRFKVGDAVRAGAVVATIHASDIAERQDELETTLRAAQKDLTEKERQLAGAEKLAAQRQELFKQDLIARRDWEQAETAAQTARAQTDLARAQLSQQEAMLAQARKIHSLAEITAPIGGAVSRRWVESGAAIAESSPILSIADGSRVKFTGSIAGASASGLRQGLSAVISSAAAAGESIEPISRLQLTGENDEAVAEIEIQIKTATGKFRFGTAAQALITLDRAKEVLQVPQAAIVETAGKKFVFKLADGRAVRQEVTLGAAQGKDVVIEQGVRATDVVIVDNLRALKPASRVRISADTPGLK